MSSAAVPTRVCKKCRWAGRPAESSGVEVGLAILLCCLFIIPGVAFLIYLSSRNNRCPRCREATIPVDSPLGRSLLGSQTPKSPQADPNAKPFWNSEQPKSRNREEYKKWVEEQKQGPKVKPNEEEKA